MLQRIARFLLIPAALIALLTGCGETPPGALTATVTLPGTATLLATPDTSTSLPTAARLTVDGQAVSIPTEDRTRQLEGTLYGKSDLAIIFSNMGAQRQETWD